MKETPEQIIRRMENHAEKHGHRLNPDRKTVEAIARGLIRNKEKYGKQYCPCRIVKNSPEEDKKIICPCIYHLDEIKEMGHCLCNLFVK